jgi:hypothetical protein
MADRRTKITGKQIKDLTIELSDLSLDLQAFLHEQNTDTKLLVPGINNILDQQWIGQVFDINISPSYSQTFIAGQSGSITKVALRIEARYSPALGFTCEIRTLADEVLGSVSVAPENCLGQGTDTFFVFPTPIAGIISGTSYNIYIHPVDIDEIGYFSAFDDVTVPNKIPYKTYMNTSAIDLFDSGVLESDLSVTPGIKINGDPIEYYADAIDKRHQTVANELPTGFINDSNVTFVLANTPIVGTVQVYLNGIYQEPGAGKDYTISGATITFAAAPNTGDILLVNYDKA